MATLEESRDLLRRLGRGESIESICRHQVWSREQFDAWWQEETRSRLSVTQGSITVPLERPVTIGRDRWGIPHIFAERTDELFFGFGYAMAQDRLFQLDYLRRKGAGRLAEILGRAALEYDVLVRTVGLRRIAEDEWNTLAKETRETLESFSHGINAAIKAFGDRLPIEFDLLDYRPEPWSPLDCLTIELEFRWYLTGRFPVIVMPELAKRALGDERLYQAFLSREADEESIISRGEFSDRQAGLEALGPVRGRHTHGSAKTAPLGAVKQSRSGSGYAGSDPDAGVGSNNWVISGRHTRTGLPLVASDPHIAFEAVSCWYEVHLDGGPYHVTGMSYVGMPAVMFGRTERVAWGCTNNICSQRDLYRERTDPEHPGSFYFAGKWESAASLEERIDVRDDEPVSLVVRFSRNGPLVNHVLPPPARGEEPVSLRWLGAYGGGWLTALQAMNRADSCDSLRAAMQPWMVPTFSVVFADVDGHIGYQMTGRIPVRQIQQRGYRPGWDESHQWQGLIPYAAAPQSADPEQGWIATANHRPAPDSFPYPLSGTWPDGLRAKRIRERLEADRPAEFSTCVAAQLDTCSPRARTLTPAIVACLRRHASGSDHFENMARHLEDWDSCYELDSVGATLYDVFFQRWCDQVAAARFDSATASLLVNGIASLAASLIVADPIGWFPPGQRETALRTAAQQTWEYLIERLGEDSSQWTWGRVHRLPLKHVLSARGDLGSLLDHGGTPARGSSTTVCNTWPGPDLSVRTGCSYRLIADLASSPPGLWAVDSQSQSGQPGSLHYADQLGDWTAGQYHFLALTRELEEQNVTARLRLKPDSGAGT